MQRWLTEAAGATGWDGLGNWGSVLAALAALTALGALGCLVPATQGIAREALRYGSLGTFGVALWKLIDTPGPNQLMEPRVGAFIAVAAALIAVPRGRPSPALRCAGGGLPRSLLRDELLALRGRDRPRFARSPAPFAPVWVHKAPGTPETVRPPLPHPAAVRLICIRADARDQAPAPR